MVFVLKEVSTGKELCLGFNGTYAIGRKKRDNIQIVINDKTVSKNHAVIYIQNGIATIKDLNSKRGTFLNKIKIARPIELRNGDVIIFGIQDSKFCFLDPKWETQIDINNFSAEKLQIIQTLDLLGVKYYYHFSDDVTHYTTDKVTFECLKKKDILYCLIDRKPIVCPKFWYDVLEKSTVAEEIPKLTNYIPKVDKYLEAQGVNNIGSNLARRFLFDDKIFIFFDINMKYEYTQVINKCDGHVTLYENSKDFISQLLREKCINYVLVINDMNVKYLLEMQYLQKILRENKKSCCIVSPNNILINILRVSFNNFTNIKNLFSDSNSMYNPIIETNEIGSESCNENIIEKTNYLQDSLQTQEHEKEKEVIQTCNNVSVRISKSMNVHHIKRNPKTFITRHANRLVINPLQQIRQRNMDVIRSKQWNCANINNHYINHNKNNSMLYINLSTEKHIVLGVKNRNKRMIMNPVSATFGNIIPNEVATSKPLSEDIEYWKKKYKKIEITEL